MNIIKTCIRCSQEKELEKFCKSAKAKDGRRGHCKSCHNKHYQDNKESLTLKHKEYYRKNKENLSQKSKERYLLQKDLIREKVRKYEEQNRDKVLLNKRNYAKKNKEKIAAYRANNRDKINSYVRNKMKTNQNFKLATLLRNRIRTALKNNYKCSSSIDLLGCSVEELRAYLQSKFLPGMTWKNHTTDGWHIDHIIPCVAFDLTKEEEQRKCFHYTNLQPLWAIDNFRKNGSYIFELNY